MELVHAGVARMRTIISWLIGMENKESNISKIKVTSGNNCMDPVIT